MKELSNFRIPSLVPPGSENVGVPIRVIEDLEHHHESNSSLNNIEEPKDD